MHLTEDGFLTLIHNPSWPTTLPDDKPWNELWTDYLSEASRFDARKLIALFGSDEPVHRPDKEPRKWTRNDFLLIGEFLRRHHARLAHEIAVIGVPGPTGPSLQLQGFPKDLAQIAGLIARSHGMPLRSCLAYLDQDDPREFKGIHAVFLMALLRIADYLQLKAERAPKQLLQVRKLQSPLSQEEWLAHAAVIDIRNTHSDPEAIFVQAAPPDASTYLKLKRLLHGLQVELDKCWAVIGEVYGRFAPLDQLGLNLRRVRSNLDNREQFALAVSYIPVEAKFDTAGADLLKLLIQPLYGDRPEVGIRELLQNSVDACLELRDFREQQSISIPVHSLPQWDVVVEIEETTGGDRFVTVSDSGIGMTPEVLNSYFLKAGASFRRSDAWRQQHETATGQSRVLRSGRFGVGALAAFLIGDQIEVSTRHVTMPQGSGVKFAATLETENIQLDYVSREIGTSIRIRVSDKNIWERLNSGRPRPKLSEGNYIPDSSWDWYCLQSPRVGYRIVLKGTETDCTQSRNVPGAGTPINPPWHRLHIEGYSDVHWIHDVSIPQLICNGIIVKRRRSYYSTHTEQLTSGMKLLKPTVSVFDPDGRLPLNLQRTELAVSKLPFQPRLIDDQCRDFIAWALANAPSKLPSVDGGHELRHPASQLNPPQHTFAFTIQGSVLTDEYFFQQLATTRAIFYPSSTIGGLGLKPKSGELFVPLDLAPILFT